MQDTEETEKKISKRNKRSFAISGNAFQREQRNYETTNH
jgi:hypothetical protein